MTPHRSMLFMPASNERALNKAETLPVDTIIVDLEDALHEGLKQSAVELLKPALARNFGQTQVLVRINALDTDRWKQDVDSVVEACASGGTCHGLVVPKVDTVGMLDSLFEYLPAQDPMPVWIMIESPVAVLDARALCGYGASVTGVLVGTADLSKSLRLAMAAGEAGEAATPARLGLLASLSHIVLAARAAGIVVIDGVYMDIKDAAGFEQEARQGLELGFDGKTLIHPAQVEPTNRIFAPSEAEIEDARAMIDAWHAANSEGHAVCTYKGRLVERLHVEQAEARLALYEQTR